MCALSNACLAPIGLPRVNSFPRTHDIPHMRAPPCALWCTAVAAQEPVQAGPASAGRPPHVLGGKHAAHTAHAGRPRERRQGAGRACAANTLPTKAPRHLVDAYSDAMLADSG